MGFIRDLPHTLVEAFQATLQEAADADLLLHVVDAREPGARRADAPRSARARARSAPADVPQIVVFNKLDRLDETERPRALVDAVELPDGGRRVPRVFVSALSGEGPGRCCATRSPTAATAPAERRLERAPSGRI